MRKGRRADGRALLQAAALAQEKVRLGAVAYATATTALNGACPNAGTCLSEQRFYQLATPITANGVSYTLSAAAQGAQSSDSACTPLTYDVAAGGVITYGPSNTCWAKSRLYSFPRSR